MPQYHPKLLSIAWPVLVTAFLPSFIAPSFTSKLIFLSLLLWLAREARLFSREYLVGRQAKACGAKLAPCIQSVLPFGLSFIRHRIRILTTGTPESALEHFQAFPAGTKVIRARCLGTETIMTRSHLDAKHILTTGFSKYGKPPNAKAAFKPLLGQGIFVSDQRGTWSSHRALTRPHFSRDRVADVNACEEHADRVVEWLKEKATTQEAVDIQDVFSRFTLTVATQHIFGHCVDALNVLFTDREVKSQSTDFAYFSRDFEDSQEHSLKMLLLPPFVSQVLHTIIPNKALEGVFKVVDELMANTEQNSLKEHEDGEAKNLIEHLRCSGSSTELIRHEAINILLAARDTTASLLTSCIYELAGRDELWTRLQSEVSQLNGPSISLEDIRKLKLLRAVIQETLRLHPPAWMNFRYAYEDDVLPSGIFVPAGSDCHFFIQDFQKDPEVWGKDSSKFDPERWIDGRQVSQSKDPFSFQPFSAGPRICIGQQFAYTEVSIALVKLVQAFSGVKLVASKDSIEQAPTVTISVRGGLWVKFQR